MYKHILIPTDGSALSEMAIWQGVALASSLNAKVTGLTVSPTFQACREDCDALAEKYLGVVKEAARAAGVPSDSVHAVRDHPYEAIIDTATAKGCDLIFMASHGRKGVTALILGSETTKVLTHSKVPVLVCR